MSKRSIDDNFDFIDDVAVSPVKKRIVKKVTKTSRKKEVESVFKTPSHRYVTPEKKYDSKSSLKEKVQKAMSAWKSLKPTKGYEYREKCRSVLMDSFRKSVPEQYKDNQDDYYNLVEIIVWAIEGAVYDNYFVNLPTEYSQKIRALCRYIPKDTLRFLKFDPVFTGTMDVNEMTCDKVVDVNILQEPIKQKDIFGSKSEIMCKKCKKYTVSYTEANTRSADEGFIYIIIFNECRSDSQIYLQRMWRQVVINKINGTKFKMYKCFIIHSRYSFCTLHISYYHNNISSCNFPNSFYTDKRGSKGET